MTRFFRVIGLEFAAIDGSPDKIKERSSLRLCSVCFLQWFHSLLLFCTKLQHLPQVSSFNSFAPTGMFGFLFTCVSTIFLTRKQNGRDSFHLPIFIIRMFRGEGSRGPAPPYNIWTNENRCISKEQRVKVCVSWS